MSHHHSTTTNTTDTENPLPLPGNRNHNNHKENASESTPLLMHHHATNGPTLNKNNDNDNVKKDIHMDSHVVVDKLHQPHQWWSNLIFQWFQVLLQRGNDQQKLDVHDLKLIPLPNACQTSAILSTFDTNWDRELHLHRQQKQQQHQPREGKKKPTTQPPQPSLVRALYKSFGREYVRAGMLKAVHDLLVFVGPQVLHSMIHYLQDSSTKSMTFGLVLTALITCSQITMSLCLRHYFFKCYTTGLKIRSAMVMAVYRKALKLSPQERHVRTVGEITNLSSLDAQRLQDLTTYLHALWYSPLQISLALYFLFQLLGPAASLGGVLIMLCMIPLTKCVAQYMGQLQRILMQHRDARVQLNAEVLAGMKVIKYQAWEDPFAQRLVDLRNIELQHLWHYLLASTCSRITWTFTPLLVALASFASYVLWTSDPSPSSSSNHHLLQVSVALPALALFEILRFPLAMLPMVINNTVESYVSVQRIQSFLLANEYTAPSTTSTTPCTKSSTSTTTQSSSTAAAVVTLKQVTAAYDSSSAIRTTTPSSILEKSSTSRKSSVDPLLVEKETQLALLRSQLYEAERTIRGLTQTQKQPHDREDNDMDDDDLLFQQQLSSMSSAAALLFPAAPLCLKRIHFECQPGELVAIVGGVGSGKSSILAAILGEVRIVSGQVHVQQVHHELLHREPNQDHQAFIVPETTTSALAYHSQVPFLLNATVRDNILFGHVDDTYVDEALYQRALDVCALRHDLELLPYGDATEIGEKGITLSGGQKARIALARAVFHGASVTLIDDALSAVDAHVAEHLFDQAIIGELLKPDKQGKERSVILVTNSIQFLSSPKVTQIIVMQDGRIVEKGSYVDLSNRPNSVFSHFLSVMNDSANSSAAVHNDPEGNSKIKLHQLPNAVVDSSSEKDFGKSKDEVPKTGVVLTMTEETRVTGHVGLKVYMNWCHAAGGYHVPVVILFSFIAAESMSVLSNWFLTYWSNHGTADNQKYLLSIYAAIGVGVAIGASFRNLVILSFGRRASRRLFANMLQAVLHAPMSFFDTTPTGRLVNRFSKDMFTIDEQLNYSLAMYLMTLLSVCSTIVVISGVTPIFGIFLIPMIMFYINQQKYFTITYRELKRIDSVNRSPLYALLSESVDGVAVIRSFAAGSCLIRRLTNMLDNQQHSYFLTCAAQSWLAVRLELIGTLIITFACLSAVFQKSTAGADATFAGLAGLAISYSLSVTQSLNWSVRMASDCEANLVAVERINEYSAIECEGSRISPVDAYLPNDWPSDGRIVIQNVHMRYRHGLPLVLKGLNLSIPSGSKVGIVGRTGAGKSTLMVALLRIVELEEGTIYVDGQDISQVGLVKLRSSIAVIPQDPVLYSGSVRSNLDPFDEYSDSALCESLERVGLYHPSSSIELSMHSANSSVRCRVESLDDKVLEGGSNFSVGQRQLLVIARALLHETKIVIMDEATASVDAVTDAIISECMRREFESATVLTVAHRLNTIMDSDFILVMSDGIASEFDTPENLIKKGGQFRDLLHAAARDV